MKIGGWKTRSVFERYAIVFNPDVDEAVERYEAKRNPPKEEPGQTEQRPEG